MNQWNKKNALWMVLYAVLYAVLTYLSCALGMIHPIFFVIYQISAGLLLFLVIIQDLNAWHAVRLLGLAGRWALLQH